MIFKALSSGAEADSSRSPEGSFAAGSWLPETTGPVPPGPGSSPLSAYLSLYLGNQEAGFGKRSTFGRILRALLVGTVVSLGFVLLFGLAGMVVAAGGTRSLG